MNAAIRSLRMLGAAAVLALALFLAGAFSASARAAGTPVIKHLFIIVMENENADTAFGLNPPAPYLAKTMPEEGAYVPNYFGIGHLSLDNYLGLISGQPPNLQTQADCPIFSDFLATSTLASGVAVGQGCVYPSSVQTIADQLEAAGHSWRSYAQGMATGVAAGETATCRHPIAGGADNTQRATATSQYAARHVPFVYFHSIIDRAACNRNVIDLSALPQDLKSLSTSPEYAFITPNLCFDGHDETCADGKSPAGFKGVNAFLEEWVPKIKSSAAYGDHGAILVTFDESESGAESCCNEQTGPNTINNGGISAIGSGGGRVGAVFESPCIKPGTTSQFSYNHYSALRWMEDNFGLAHLGEAGAEGLRPFGTDVFNNPECNTGIASSPGGGGGGGGAGKGSTGGADGGRPATRLGVTPRHVTAGRPHLFSFTLSGGTAACRAGAIIAFAGHKTHTSRKGKARIRARLSHPGKFTAVATPPACKPAKATVHAH